MLLFLLYIAPIEFKNYLTYIKSNFFILIGLLKNYIKNGLLLITSLEIIEDIQETFETSCDNTESVVCYKLTNVLEKK